MYGCDHLQERMGLGDLRLILDMGYLRTRDEQRNEVVLKIQHFLVEGPYAPMRSEARYIDDQSGRNIDKVHFRLVLVPKVPTRQI